MPKTAQELRAEIAALEKVEGTEGLVAEKRKQLAVMEKGGKVVDQKKGVGRSADDLPFSEDDWEKATSKFATVGEHVSEFGVPYWKTAGKSIAFPFVITEEGIDAGKEGEIVAGVEPHSVWKLKEILRAIGWDMDKKPRYSEIVEFAPGKSVKTIWTVQVDSRSPEEGGKGGRYTKPTGAVSLETESADLGV